MVRQLDRCHFLFQLHVILSHLFWSWKIISYESCISFLVVPIKSQRQEGNISNQQSLRTGIQKEKAQAFKLTRKELMGPLGFLALLD